MNWRSITTTIIETYKVLGCLSCTHGLSLTELSPCTVCIAFTVYIKRLTNVDQWRARGVSLTLFLSHSHVHTPSPFYSHTNSLVSVSRVQPNSCVKVLFCNNKQYNIRVYTHTHTHIVFDLHLKRHNNIIIST